MRNTITLLSIFAVILIAISCKKEKPGQPGAPLTKKVRFILYTNEDLSKDNDTVSFALVIRDNTGATDSHTIFDTTLATRRFKDIPGPANKLVFEKTVPDNGSVLTVGFIYTDRFGVGSRFDTVGINEKLKVFEYPFQ